jgi:hypothetical protein
VSRARPAPGGGRLIGLPPERLGAWLDGVADRHGAFTVRVDGEVVEVTCADSTTLVLRAPFGWTPGPSPLTTFTVAARAPRRAAVLLVRRGRWAVGVFAGPDLVVSKVDSRQVQGRTAAGGWSQQRYARRRGHQTDAVVAHAVETAARVVGPHVDGLDALFVGGDRLLVDDVLADRALTRLAPLRRDPFLDVGEPTKAVLLSTPEQFRAVSVHITEPHERP